MTIQENNIENVQSFVDVIKDAVEASQTQSKGKAEGQAVSQELMELGARFVNGSHFDVGVSPNGVKEFKGESPLGFLGECYKAEEFIKSDAAGLLKVDKIPTCWSTAKSNIKQAYVKYGILPTDHETESALREDLNTKRNADKAEEGQVTIEATEDGSNIGFLQRVEVLNSIYNQLPESDRIDMELSLEGVINDYNAILDTLVPEEPTPPVDEVQAA